MEGRDSVIDQEIVFETEARSTRSFINNESLETTGTQLCIYGFHDDNPLSEGTAMKLQGKALTFADDKWLVMEDDIPLHFYWAESGKYKFYGWLAYDAAGKLATPSTWTYNANNKLLSIPSTVVNKDYNQYDFVYSDVHNREFDASTPDNIKYAEVPFALNHLFSAISIGAQNSSSEDVIITKVALEGIHDQGSANIDYSSNSVVVTYSTSMHRSSDTPFVAYDNVDGYLIKKGNGIVGNAFTNATNKSYYIIWPQKKEILAPTTPVSGDAEREFAATDSLLVVEYSIADTKYRKRVKFPDMDWEAGKMYHFDILFADKMVVLEATVNPWNYSSAEVDFSEGTVTVKEGGKLVWDESTCIVDDTEKRVYVSNGQAIEARFVIDTPKGGQWRVSLEGDTHAFTLTDDVSPIDDAMGAIDGKQHTVRIIPKITNPDRDYKAQLKFVVLTADGRIISADDVIQDKDGDNNPDIYQIVLLNVN